MTHRVGHWIDLVEAAAAAKFNEVADNTTWIQALPLGKYVHPVYGEIEITPERARRFADNVKNKVRDIDLDIDYDHKAKTTEAAGWVKNADSRTDGVWLLVEWTKEAYQKIKDKAYRYFSAEFADEWEHPKSNQKFEDVILGGGLTNRPFIKDILPINLSELVTDPPPPGDDGGDGPPEPNKEEEGVDGKQLREALKLSEDATDDQVLEAIKKLGDPAPPTPDDPDKLPDLTNMSVEDLVKQLSDVSGNPAIKALTELVEVQHDQLKKFSRVNREQEVESQLSELDNVNTKLQVPPATREQLKKIMLESPKELAEQVYNAYKRTLELGVVDMTERGWQPRGDKTPTKRFNEEVARLQKDNPNMDYADAVTQISSEQPQLFEEYRQESFAGRE